MGIIVQNESYSDLERNTASVAQMLAHPARIKIVIYLLLQDELTLHQITEVIGHLSQSSVSAQVKKLKDESLLECKQVGTAIYYSVNRRKFDSLRWSLEVFLDRMKELA